MGHCLSCLKDNDSHRSKQQNSSEHNTVPFSVSYHHSPSDSRDTAGADCHNVDQGRCTLHQRSSSAANSTLTAASLCTADNNCVELNSTGCCSNGATAPSKLPSIMGITGGGSSNASTASEKRSFYSRIPPLTRSSSHETRRHSSKDYYSETKINTLFDVYREPPTPVNGSGDTEDVMLTEGIQRFCSDMEVSPDDFRILLFAWKCQAETMCRFTRSEFALGCKSLKVDSIKGILSKLPEVEIEVQELDAFKNMYRWAFKFGLDNDCGQRILPADMAILLWRLVFEQRKPPLLDRWLKFLECHPSIRGIPRDTWNMYLNFSETVGNDLSTYDDTEAWPSLFDDFVEYENDQLNQNISKEKQ